MNLVFDIGGTKTRVALSDGKDLVGGALIYETPKDYNLGINLLVENSKKLTSESIETVAGGIAGVLDISKSTLTNCPNLTNWSQKNFKKDLEEAFRCLVKIENDSALSALGEAVFGAGRDVNVISFLTFGTGVGGARIVNKNIDNNLFGFEPGHHIVDVKSFLEGKEANLEYLASGVGVEKWLLKKPYDIKDQNLWNRVMDYMSIGIANTLCFWPCDKFVIGGGLVRHQLTDLSYINMKVSNFVKIYKSIPQIVKAQLGELSCLYGAIAYLLC
ncbi:MAG: ROK family protein [Patescibacteria group bacterium]|nr:ROK family protein [Patescibacteria group bacterium]